MASERWVSFDVGETLIDETRVWSTWADLLGITRFTFMAALGSVIERGADHQDVFRVVGRADWADHRAEFDAAYGGFQEVDLYADAVDAMNALRGAGYRLSIFANQPAERTAELRFLGIRPDLMAMSAEWGVHKPDTRFYERALTEMGAAPGDVAYVGDRLDNDVRPSATAGIRPVWIRRGPWGVIVDNTDVPPGTLVVDTLGELVERIGDWWP
jgi:HAD superfamily hydrolase (TIGR01549 family)